MRAATFGPILAGAALSLVVALGTASAADLDGPRYKKPAPVYAPVEQPYAYDKWTGFYFGGTIGQSLGAGLLSGDLAPDSLLQADAMTLVVLPLVGFDRRGHRLGMGGGWYDRSFAFRQRSPAPPWLVGAGFADQQVEALEPADWDVALDAVCTERETLHFTPPTA